MRVIAVPVSDRPECRVALATALDLAKELSASVQGYHLLPNKQKASSGQRSMPWSLIAPPPPSKLLTNSEVKKRRVKALKLFEELALEKDFSLTKTARFKNGGGLAKWNEIAGSPEKIYSIVGPVSDLHVVSRPAKKTAALAQSYMLSALMYSGRPVLVLPQKQARAPGRRILIAWNQSMESMAVAAAALPLLQKAESVSIVTSGKDFRVGPKSKHLKEYLKYWNVKVTEIKTRGASAEKEIMRAYADSKSDLLVMGAYSRSHWREKIFGGVTDHFLNEANIPVLMMHRS